MKKTVKILLILMILLFIINNVIYADIDPDQMPKGKVLYGYLSQSQDTFSEDEAERFNKYMNEADTNKDGNKTLDEVMNFIKSNYGGKGIPSDAEITKTIKKYSSEHGKITVENKSGGDESTPNAATDAEDTMNHESRVLEDEIEERSKIDFSGDGNKKDAWGLDVSKWSEPSAENNEKINNIAGTVLATIRNIAAITTVIVIMIVGIKYIVGSAEQKADYKKSFKPIVIGVLLVTMGTEIITLLYNARIS